MSAGYSCKIVITTFCTGALLPGQGPARVMENQVQRLCLHRSVYLDKRKKLNVNNVVFLCPEMESNFLVCLKFCKTRCRASVDTASTGTVRGVAHRCACVLCWARAQGPTHVMDRKVVLVDGPRSCRSQLIVVHLCSSSSSSLTCKSSKISLLKKTILVHFCSMLLCFYLCTRCGRGLPT